MGSCKMSYGMMSVCVYGAPLVLMMMMMMMMAGEVAGQAAPAPSVDCMTVVLTLTDCLTFVTGSAATPPAACCTELSAVIKNNPQCLCLLFNTTFTKPLGVNVTRAQQLPPACKLQTPPTSLCSLLGVPVPGPTSATSPVAAPSPAAKTPTSTAAPSAPASGPAIATPTSSPALAPTMAPTPSSGPVAATPSSSPPAPMSAGSPMAQSNTSTTAPPPSSAPSITSRGAAISASFLFLASIILS